MKSGIGYLRRSAVLVSVFVLLTTANVNGQNTPAKSPKLILQITVDQLRGDMPASVYDRLGKGATKIAGRRPG